MFCSRATIAALVAVSLAGCAAEAKALTSVSDVPALEGTAWLLAELPGHSPAKDRPATLRFEKGRAQGFDGCNRFTAPYTTQGPALEIAVPGAATMMACPPDRVHEAQAFATALSGARRFRVEGGVLALLDFEGRVIAKLSPQPAGLAGTFWQAMAINNGKQAVASVVRDSTVTLELSADGKASGSSGCNRYTTTYQSDGAKLSFAPAAATRKMCPRPEVMEQEQSFLKALETVATARFEGDRLELRTASGALAVTLVRAARP